MAENLFLGREPRDRLRLVDRRRMRREALGLLERAGVTLDPSRRIRSLRVGERQLVEIAKALSQDARILVMDEPTAALADHEVEQLFRVVARAAPRGRRRRLHLAPDGGARPRSPTAPPCCATAQLVGTVDAEQSSRRELIGMMVGRPLRDLFPKGDATPGEELLALSRTSAWSRAGHGQGGREPARRLAAPCAPARSSAWPG